MKTSTCCRGAASCSDTVANAQTPMLTAAEKADGWKLMFDGKSLAGWRGYKTEKPSSAAGGP